MQGFDHFQSNILGMSGPIRKDNFDFTYSRIQVWQAGKCVDDEITEGQVIGRITLEGELLFSITGQNIALKYVHAQSCFPELSANGDRLLWSVDLLDRKGPIPPNQGSILSLMFRGGKLCLIKLNVDSPTPTQIEFLI